MMTMKSKNEIIDLTQKDFFENLESKCKKEKGMIIDFNTFKAIWLYWENPRFSKKALVRELKLNYNRCIQIYNMVFDIEDENILLKKYNEMF